MAFFTGFGFLTIRANLKQNYGCAACFDANFQAKRELGTEFLTSLSFLTIRANWKENDSYAV